MRKSRAYLSATITPLGYLSATSRASEPLLDEALQP